MAGNRRPGPAVRTRSVPAPVADTGSADGASAVLRGDREGRGTRARRCARTGWGAWCGRCARGCWDRSGIGGVRGGAGVTGVGGGGLGAGASRGTTHDAGHGLAAVRTRVAPAHPAQGAQAPSVVWCGGAALLAKIESIGWTVAVVTSSPSDAMSTWQFGVMHSITKRGTRRPFWEEGRCNGGWLSRDGSWGVRLRRTRPVRLGCGFAQGQGTRARLTENRRCTRGAHSPGVCASQASSGQCRSRETGTGDVVSPSSRRDRRRLEPANDGGPVRASDRPRCPRGGRAELRCDPGSCRPCTNRPYRNRN